MTTFESLIEPVSLRQFFGEYLEKKPLLINRGSPDHYVDLFSLQDMEEIIYRDAGEILSDGMQLRRVGTGARGATAGEMMSAAPPTADAVNASAWLRSHYRQGYTASVSVQRRSSALMRLVQEAQMLFQCRVQFNAYLTPPRAQGLPVHCDAHDTVILQIHGEKRWRLHGRSAYLPLEAISPSASTKRAVAAAQQLILRPGDLLYLPRGYAHEARSGAGASLHLTMGILSYRWFELLTDMSQQLANADDRFRERVPFAPGGAGPGDAAIEKTLRLALKHLRDRRLVQLTLDRHRQERIEKYVVDRGICDQAPVSSLNRHTRIRRIAPCQVNVRGGKASISYPGGSIEGPRRILPALRFIHAAQDAFAVGAVAGSLDDSAKQVLVSRLVAEGLLEVASTPKPRSSLRQGRRSRPRGRREQDTEAL